MTEPSPRFLAFLPFIFQWEGTKLEIDPHDPGGMTKFGIDKRSHPSVDIAALTPSSASEIYWSEWNEDGCEPMPSPYAEVFFNCAVNMGLHRAQEFDKQIPGADALAFLSLQEKAYNDLASSHKNFQRYLHGWLNRTAALRERFFPTPVNT